MMRKACHHTCGANQESVVMSRGGDDLLRWPSSARAVSTSKPRRVESACREFNLW